VRLAEHAQEELEQPRVELAVEALERRGVGAERAQARQIGIDPRGGIDLSFPHRPPVAPGAPLVSWVPCP
jgi:hypothetical protein